MPKNERIEDISEKSLDLERVRQSMMEELEATSLYQERIDVTKDETLKAILKHNMDEEKEHIAMLMEWLRKNDPVQDEKFKSHD